MKLRETHDYIGLRLQQSRKPMDFLCTNSEFGLSIRPIPLSSYLPWFLMYCAPLVRSSRLDYSQMQARVFGGPMKKWMLLPCTLLATVLAAQTNGPVPAGTALIVRLD